MTRKGKLRLVVDRVEGDLAVLVVYDDNRVKFNLPLKYLPEGVGGGDHLQATFSLDKRSRDDEESRVEFLLKELTNKKAKND